MRTQLRVSGVTAAKYWGSHLIIDAIQMYVVAIVGIIIILVVGAALGKQPLATPGAIFMFVVFMIVFVPTDVMFSYCVGFLFKDYKTCQAVAPLVLLYVSKTQYTLFLAYIFG